MIRYIGGILELSFGHGGGLGELSLLPFLAAESPLINWPRSLPFGLLSGARLGVYFRKYR